MRLPSVVLTVLLLLTMFTTPVLAEPLSPSYYLPTETEMLSGFVLTKASGPHFNEGATAYLETRSYQRDAPFAMLHLSAAISPETSAAHQRFTRIVGNLVTQGYFSMPSDQGEESTALWKVGPDADSYMLIWRAGPIIGSVGFIDPAHTTSSRDAGYQMGLIARPMLDRMASV